MKRKEHVSKSTYRAILGVQKSRDEKSGLFVSDRFFRPEKAPQAHRLRWILADMLLLCCLVLGLSFLTVSGFSVPVSPWFYPAVLLASAGTVLLFQNSWCARHKIPVSLGVLLLYLFLLFLCQDTFFRGRGQFCSLILDTLNRGYSGEPAVSSAVTGMEDAQVFLFFLVLPVVFWLGFSLFRAALRSVMWLLLFPLLTFLVLCKAADNAPALFLILFSIVLSRAHSRPRKQYRMWGGKDRKLQRENRLRFQAIQKKSMALVLLACVALSVPGFWLVRPLLSVSLKPAEELSVQVQSAFLNKMLHLLPEISAGEWNLKLETIGGGVQDGAVESGEGYLLEEVEDLRLTLNQKPEETLFLKGYIGTVYKDGSWESNYGSTFDGTAMNWNTDGSPRLYIQNLPFLRTVFALDQKDTDDREAASAMSAFSLEPAQLLVERINANESYTYVPYGAYLNDYYLIDSGDGAVVGQSEQEDRYLFFFREDMKEILTAWNSLEKTDNVLDRVEESYHAFCDTGCLELYEGADGLKKTVDKVILENRWKASENQEEITSWIRSYLSAHYHYQENPASAPEGMDALEYFLFESGDGNSVQFASAAVLLYRMFGIPARYVVGYEVPAGLFRPQADGTYTSTVQGDNSQAWAEIYVPGVGWLPEDMTPGVVGTFEEVGPGGEKIASPEEKSEEKEGLPDSPESNQSGEEAAQQSADGNDAGGIFHGRLTVADMIRLFLVLSLSVLMITGFGFGWHHLDRNLGFDPFHRRPGQQKLVLVFQTFYARMQKLGLSENTDSQSEEFLFFCENELRKRRPDCVPLLRPAVEVLYLSCFGNRDVSEKDIRVMRTLLLAAFGRRKKTNC